MDHRIHDTDIGRAAAALLLEEFELQDQIVGVLAGKFGIGRVSLSGAGAVAVNAGGDTLTRDPSIGNGFAALDSWCSSIRVSCGIRASRRR